MTKFLEEPQWENSIIGNFKLPHKRAKDVEQFFIESGITHYVITKEGQNSDDHLHFWFQDNLKIKLKSFKDKIVLKFPELKRDEIIKDGKKQRGGENKYVVKLIKEELQFHYIFKEMSQESDMLHSKNLQVDWKSYHSKYHLHKQCSGSKFYKWIKLTKKPSDTLGQKHKLIKYYIQWSIDENRAVITSHDCDKHCNYILSRINPQILVNEFISKICGNYYPLESDDPNIIEDDFSKYIIPSTK